MTGKKRIRIKNKQLKTVITSGGTKNARKDFFELLRRATLQANEINK